MTAIKFFFELQHVDHFRLKSFSLFSIKGLRGRGQLRVGYRSGTALLIKLRHCFIRITAKNKFQETTLRKSCYYDNHKTKLPMTKYLALQNKYQKKK